jgi:hypothetical protein
MSTPSPAQRHMSMSPTLDMAGAHGAGMRHHHPQHHHQPQQQQQHNDFAYMANNSIPVHLRGDLHHSASPTSTSSLNVRPTSHPTGYGPPAILEPSIEPHFSGPSSSTCGSPHLSSISSVGWQSPQHVPSPTHSSSYIYTEPDYQQAHHHHHHHHMGLYYGAGGAGGQLRRPQSSEPGLVHMA